LSSQNERKKKGYIIVLGVSGFWVVIFRFAQNHNLKTTAPSLFTIATAKNKKNTKIE